MKKRDKYKLFRFPYLLFAIFALILFSTSPGNANTTAQVQTDYHSATTGGDNENQITADQTTSEIEPYLTADVTMEWDPNQEDSVTGYLLYYGNASGKYLSPIDVGLTTTYTVHGLSTKQKWFFAVKAYDAANNQSGYSNEVTKDPLSGSGENTSSATSFTHAPLALNQDFGVESDSSSSPPPLSENLQNNSGAGKIVAGTGPWASNGGWIKSLTVDYFHKHWSRSGWPYYNNLRGESRVARGDIDGDGKDEIIIGMGPVTGDHIAPSGHFQVLDDNHQHLFWGQINWGAYNEGNGEIWPACGDLDGDGKDEILIGLGQGGMGIIEVFSVNNNQLNHLSWMASSWDEYNMAHGEVRPTSGDLDGDGKDDIIIGFGSVADNPEIPGGAYEILASNGEHMAWGEVGWDDYNQLNGESRPAIGDLNGDGINEIIIGLGTGANGAFEIQNYNDGTPTNHAWLETPWWQEYNEISGETRPAVGNLDGDDSDELVIASGPGGGGWIHLFDDQESSYNHYISLQLWPEEYNLNNGASWITIQEGTE
ncbi:MAG: VCBS repeat-containing protein [Deltaproteobacteria bacterium]|nr:VCBS repeat-containing protein [Candidatus Tharpella aukensis]